MSANVGPLQPVVLYDANGNVLVGQKTMAASLPVAIASDQTPLADVSVTGTLGALNDSLVVSLAGKNGVGFALSVGTLAATITTELSFDGGSVYVIVPLVLPTTSPLNTTASSFNVTNPNAPIAGCIPLLGGATHAKIKVTSYTSGTCGARITATSSAAPVVLQLPTTLVGGRLDENIGAWLGSTAPTVGSKTSANSLPVVIASDQVYAENSASANGETIFMAGVVQQAADAALSGDGNRSEMQVDATGFLKTNVKAWLGSTAPTVGQKTMANSIPVAIASDQTVLPVDLIGTTISKVVSGIDNIDLPVTLPGSLSWSVVAAFAGFNAIVSFQVSLDGVNFFPIDNEGWIVDGPSVAGSWTKTKQLGAIVMGSGARKDGYLILAPGVISVRMKIATYTSGQATIELNNSAAPMWDDLSMQTADSPVVPLTRQVGGTDGTLVRTLGAFRNRSIPASINTLAPAGLDSDAVMRAIRASKDASLRTTSETLLWHDALEGSTVNAFWTQSTTTMTIAQATGVLTLNNANITTLNTDAIVTSKRQYPAIPRQPLSARFRALITANAAANHTLVELGFGAPVGVTAAIANGAFFRWRVDGTLAAVTSYNGTENVSQVLAQGALTVANYYDYEVILEDDFARFIVVDSGGTPLVDITLKIPVATAAILAVSHIPSFARVYVDATGGGTAIKLSISAHVVQLLDGLMNVPWAEQMAYAMRQASINPTTYAQTPQLAAGAAPATITPNNTGSTAYNSLGGEYAVALTVASENLLGVFGFQIPSPYTFMLTGITFEIPHVATTIGVTGIPSVSWSAIANCASASPSTGGGQRFTLGAAFLYTAITQAAGVFCINEGSLIWIPKVPIACLPGTFLNLCYKVFTTTAAATPGVTRGTINVDGYFV